MLPDDAHVLLVKIGQARLGVHGELDLLPLAQSVRDVHVQLAGGSIDERQVDLVVHVVGAARDAERGVLGNGRFLRKKTDEIRIDSRLSVGRFHHDLGVVDELVGDEGDEVGQNC